MTSPCLFATQSSVTAGGRRLKKSGPRLSPPGSYMRPGRDLRRGRHRQVLVNPRLARSRPQTQQINEVNSMATTVVRMPVQVELAGRRITYECQLEHTALVPKGRFLTVAMLGKCIDEAVLPRDSRQIVHDFLTLPQIERILPGI